MIVCFDCDRDVKAILDELCHNEGIDYGQAVAGSLRVYHSLRSEISPGGSVAISGSTVRRHLDAIGDRDNIHLRKRVRPLGNIPKSFRLPEDSLEETSPQCTQVPPTMIPAEDWLFGQYNKLLPLKATCRAMANATLAGDDLSEAVFPEEVAAEAAILGQVLRQHDEQHAQRREDALATAFPSTGTEGEKSRSRFSKQFVGRLNSQGRLQGLPSSLRLIVHQESNENPVLTLTAQGWQFATLPNPALDEPSEEFQQPLSDDERAFLTSHIATFVPEEVSAFLVILEAMAAGVDTPTELDREVRRAASREAASRLSDSFFSTQRSGVVSRMIDLALLERVRSGVTVHYVTTNSGSSFLSESRKQFGKA